MALSGPEHEKTRLPIIEMLKVLGWTEHQLQQPVGQATGASTALTTTEKEPPSSAVDQLTQLVELHAAGALTDEEFSRAKSQVLGD